MNNKISDEQLKHFIKEVKDATKLLQLAFPCPEFRREWIPRHEVMQYLGFGSTQMNAISKKYNLRKSTIGKRIFYSVQQIIDLLNKEAENC
jgi:hypothetical protein